MRQIIRLPLPKRTANLYQRWTVSIQRKRKPSTRKAEADRLWNQARGTKAMMGAVLVLRKMNNNLQTCMYCEHDTATALKDGKWRAIIEHWEPRAEAPERAFDWDNHFLSCHRCNTFFKGSDFPRDPSGAPLLLNPVDDDPELHLEYEPSNGAFAPLGGSPKGDKTIRFFDLQQFDGSRVSVWEAVIEHLRKYDRALKRGDRVRADRLRAFVVESCHRSVIMRLVQVARGAYGDVLTAPDFPALVTAHAVETWL